MSTGKLAGRYAKSILDLAVEKGQLEEVNNDVNMLSNALKNRDLYLLVKSPIVNSEKKLTILKRIFGDALSVITASFIDIVVRKRREKHLPEIVAAFQEQYKERKGIVPAKLTTATAVDDALLTKVKGIILRDTGKQNVELETEVDESLLGGFILQFENKLYDCTIAHKLQRMSKDFDKNKYIKQY